MRTTIYNVKRYRREHIKQGMKVVTEEAPYFFGTLEDIDGNMVQVDGVYDVVGIVQDVKKNFCTVQCCELSFNNGEIIIPIKEKNRYTTAINYWP